MGDAASLVCGSDQTEGIAKTALDQLGASIDYFADRAIRFLHEEGSPDTLSFGPFCSRVLLENSCAALIGRLDTFRMLYLSEFQNQPEYVAGKRAKSAFSWSGDVIPTEEKPNLWHIDHEIPKISRALFSQHLDHVYWRPAVDKMLDHIASVGSDPLLVDVSGLEAETFISDIKGRSNTLYSTLSKGVHWEFFTSALVFDEITVKAKIRDTCILVAQIALVSHFIPTAYAAHSPSEAVLAYKKFRGKIS